MYGSLQIAMVMRIIAVESMVTRLIELESMVTIIELGVNSYENKGTLHTMVKCEERKETVPRKHP